MPRHRHLWPATALLLGGAMLVGCATAPRPETPDFTPVDLRPELSAGRMVPAVDRYLIVLDASGSMGDRYRGRPKLAWAKMAAARVRQGAMGIPAAGAIRAVGDALSPFAERTAMVLDFSGGREPGAFDAALAEIDSPVGRGVLGKAIRAAGADLAGREGRTALILITDGLAADDPAAAAADLAAAMGGRLCIHGIWIGPEGQGLSTLESVVRAGDCGRVAMVEEMETPEAVAGRVKEIFLAPGTPSAAAARTADADGDGVPDAADPCPDAAADTADGCPRSAPLTVEVAPVAADSDGDGVADGRDRCPETPPGVAVTAAGCPRPGPAGVRGAAGPGDADGDGIPDDRDRCVGTPAGVRVNPAGCWIIEAILFGTDRSVVRPEYHATLDEVAAALRENPRLHVALAGHADNRGDPGYNLELSHRRAQAVAAHLAEAGIDRERLLPTGFGMAQPAAENATKAGRARNRRVEITPLRVRD
jgi:OOP family OmpA-OmpF porin